MSFQHLAISHSREFLAVYLYVTVKINPLSKNKIMQHAVVVMNAGVYCRGSVTLFFFLSVV